MSKSSYLHAAVKQDQVQQDYMHARCENRSRFQLVLTLAHLLHTSTLHMRQQHNKITYNKIVCNKIMRNNIICNNIAHNKIMGMQGVTIDQDFSWCLHSRNAYRHCAWDCSASPNLLGCEEWLLDANVLQYVKPWNAATQLVHTFLQTFSKHCRTKEKKYYQIWTNG